MNKCAEFMRGADLCHIQSAEVGKGASQSNNGRSLSSKRGQSCFNDCQ